MSRTLSLEVSEPIYRAIEVRAQAASQTAAELAAATLAFYFSDEAIGSEMAPFVSSPGGLERFFGAVDFGCADNESIDADLAREYGDNHETT